MANLIKLKRGAAASIPTLNDGEAGWTTDTFRLFIGQGGVNRLVGEADFIQKSGGTLTGALTLHADPTSAMHPATKQYVDNAVQGINAKASVKAASTANLTLSGTQTVDGVALSVGDRVLVKNQTDASENGIYAVASGAWTRASDANSWDELVSLFTWVEEGTTNGDTGWLCTVNAGGTLNTTAVSLIQFSGAGQITAGAGLAKTGNQLDVGAGQGIQVDADAITVKLDGATLAKSASGLKVAAGGIGTTEIAAAVAGNGLTGGGGSALAVNVGTGLEINADAVRVAAAAAGNGLTGGGGSALAVGAGDGITVGATSVAANIDTASGLKFDASSPKKIQLNVNGTAFSFSSGVLTPNFGTGAGQFAQGNDARFHTQNTDTGTTSGTFQVGSGGVKIKNVSGTQLDVRNAGDTDHVALAASLLAAMGGGIDVYNAGESYKAALTFAGASANRSFAIPDNAGTELLSNASAIDCGVWA